MNISPSVKLDEKNYLIWTDRLLTYVTAYGLERVIDSAFIVPPKFLENFVHPMFANWNRLNSIVKWWIYSSVSSEILGYLSCGMNTREQWVSLEESYSTNIQA